MSRSRDLVALLMIAVLACACGTTSDSDDAEGSMSDSSDGSTDPESSAPDAGRLPPEQQKAIDDLASKQGIDATDIEVVRAEVVTWRDGSLGCAEPGKMYTQALVEGQRIILAADGAEFEYHAGGSRAPFLCEHPTQ